jgi:uncharacterized RDD family membrane protein YckC
VTDSLHDPHLGTTGKPITGPMVGSTATPTTQVVHRPGELAIPDSPVRPAVAAEPAVVLRRLTRLGLGVVLASLDAGLGLLGVDDPTTASDAADRSRRTGGPTPANLGDIALGLLAVTRESAIGAGQLALEGARTTAEAAAPLARRVAAAPLISGALATGQSSLAAVFSALADAGRVERQLADAERSSAVQRGIDAVATSDLVPMATAALADGVLDEALEPVLDVVLAEALPAVTDRIATDPELMVPLVTRVLERLADQPGALDPLMAGVLERLADEPGHLLVVVDRILQPVLATATPLALQQLNDDPSVVRDLVWDQSGGIANELANSLRARTVSADDAIDRWTGRVTMRRRLRRMRRTDRHDTASSGDAVAASPVAERPATERPVAERPATEGPATEGPDAEGPAAEGSGRRGETAGFVSRAFAYVIDAVVIGILLSAATVATNAVVNLIGDGSLGVDSGAGEVAQEVSSPLNGEIAVAALSLGAVALVYFTFGWWLFGRTLGKLVMGVRVVEVGGTRPGFLQSLVRALLYPVSSILLLGFLLIAASPARRAFHDRVARTWAVYDWAAHARSAADDDPLPPTASTAATA